MQHTREYDRVLSSRSAQDFHIAASLVLREIGRVITNLPLNIIDHHRAVNINATSHLNIKTRLNRTGINSSSRLSSFARFVSSI